MAAVSPFAGFCSRSLGVGIPDIKGNWKALLRYRANSREVIDGFQNQMTIVTLVELSAKVVSQYLPYSYVEENYLNIPDCIAKRIMFWSFPRSKKDIARYYIDYSESDDYFHSLGMPSRSKSNVFLQYKVIKIVQIGFCVQGIVTDGRAEFHVSLTFDRCVITSVICSCSDECILWCVHAKTLAECRIWNGSDIEVYSPIFRTLNRLSRDQLQKLLQFLLSHHHDDTPGITPIIQLNLKKACIKDAQDMTAFSGTEIIPSWFLDIKKIKLTNHYKLSDVIPKTILEMMQANDRNGSKLLRTFLENTSGVVHSSLFGHHIVKLWTFRLAAPNMSKEEKCNYCSSLKMCLVNVAYQRNFFTGSNYERTSNLLLLGNNLDIPLHAENSAILLMPYCAGHISWDDKHLNNILANKTVSLKHDSEFDVDKELIWREHLPTACVRIGALALSGNHLESIRLSVAIARAVKDQSRRWKEIWSEIQLSGDECDISVDLVKDIVRSADAEWMKLSLINHLVNPLEILFTSLVNAPEMDQTLIPLTNYYQLAIEAVIIIFSQPDETYVRSCEEKWMVIVFTALQDKNEHTSVNSFSNVVSFSDLRDLIETLLEGGPFTSCGNFSFSVVPRYNWYLWMARAINIFDKDLAAKFSIACLKHVIKIRFQQGQNIVDDRCYELIAFVVFSFSKDIAMEALHIFFSTDDLATIIKFMLRVFHYFSPSPEKKVMCNTNKIFLFDWFLERLQSSLLTKRELKGNTILEIASAAGFEQIVHLLKNWENYIQLSESMNLALFELRFISRLPTDEKAVIKEEGWKLALRIAENEIEDKEIVFECLKNLLFSAGCYSRRSISLEAEESKILKGKMFKVAMCFAKTKPKEFILRELSSLVSDDDTFHTYYGLLSSAFREGLIYPNDVLVVRTIWDGNRFLNTMVISEKQKFILRKLCLEHCRIPINYKMSGRETTSIINHFIYLAKEAESIGEAQSMEIDSLIIENVKNTPVLYLIMEGCFEFATKEERNPSWLKKLLEYGLRILEADTFRRMRKTRKQLDNHYKRMDKLRIMIRQCNQS